jgi:hypothetical protein
MFNEAKTMEQTHFSDKLYMSCSFLTTADTKSAI